MDRRGQRYKVELLTLLRDKGSTAAAKETGDDSVVDGSGTQVVSFYKTGDFAVDPVSRSASSRCRRKFGAFKLTNVAGAYWRGDERNHSFSASTVWRFRRKKSWIVTSRCWKKPSDAITDGSDKSWICSRFRSRRTGSAAVYATRNAGPAAARRLRCSRCKSRSATVACRSRTSPRTISTRPRDTGKKFNEDLFHVRGKSGDDFASSR